MLDSNKQLVDCRETAALLSLINCNLLFLLYSYSKKYKNVYLFDYYNLFEKTTSPANIHNIDEFCLSVIEEYTGFIIQPSGSKHVIIRNFSRDFVPLIIIL